MSMTTSVEKLTKTAMAPAVPVGTIAALATIWLAVKFKVDVNGRGLPAGPVVR
jgi:hypothetical protein